MKISRGGPHPPEPDVISPPLDSIVRKGTTALAVILVALPACSQKPAPPTQQAAPSASASAAPLNLPGWAAGEEVALVHTKEAIVARAVSSRKSRTLWTGVATWVAHDPSLDLVWVQGNDTLDVIDLRASGDAVIAIARGLPPTVPLSILRTTDGGSHSSASASGCDTGRSLTLAWSAEPRLQILDDGSKGWHEPPGSTLVGAAWLRNQLARAPGAAHVLRRGFPLDTAPPAPPFAARKTKCPAESCGKPIPFDGRGPALVVTSFSEGDCQHFDCHLYDPVQKRFATPPVAASWGEIDKVPSGSCGPYHFDRSGSRFLAQTSLCTVGGACEALGGDAVGWLAGGTDVGMAY